ncbi:hypothetical protein LCGC14_0935270 [marine sediment metagenome]|uniref:Amidohydrolase-related domain-containing protein n=1 Tax=marine sediment metagenome TaxID=412755 RepID=A0A0F9NR98_9ZZZZ
MAKNLLIKNCRILNPSSKEIKKSDISLENGVIAKIEKVKKVYPFGEVLDAEGRIAAPGFVDLHIQGAGGADVLDGRRESLEIISRTCAKFGTTSFLATTVFRPEEGNHHLEVASESVGSDLGGANLLGIHLEGPFISATKRGMILPKCIFLPSLEIFKKILDYSRGKLRMMTIAPEIKGNLKIIGTLIKEGIVASFGHSNASYKETLEGIKAGISHVTHLFNTMPSFHHRKPGPLLAIFQAKRVTAQIISDGVHLHPEILRFAYDVLGEDRCIIITDGLQAMGLPEGRYAYNGVEYESREGTARYLDGTLVGTSLGLNELLERFVRFSGCSLAVGAKAVTENPARVLGIQNRKGKIELGKDADLVILDEDWSVWSTIVQGKVVFHK